MSQHVNDICPAGTSPPEPAAAKPRSRNLALIERYLAVLEANKKACRAALTDADMALDMAGFVQRKLQKPAETESLSSALLALTLVRRVSDAPEQ